MSWLEEIQNNRKRQVEQMAKAFGYDTSTIQKAEEEDISEEEETSSKSKDGDAYAGKSDMYKMRMLGLRKFNDQDQKDYIGVEDADNSYITNLDNGDIIISKTDNGYLVSKFPIDENNEGDEQEAMDLSEAIKIALRFKEELENDEDEPEQIMYKEETDKAFDDEINPFEREAWEASLSKAEIDELEKAKHADGDMHPNGKWVWRSSANGGKGDWRVASPSKRTGTNKAIASATKTDIKIGLEGNKQIDLNGITSDDKSGLVDIALLLNNYYSYANLHLGKQNKQKFNANIITRFRNEIKNTYECDGNDNSQVKSDAAKEVAKKVYTELKSIKSSDLQGAKEKIEKIAPLLKQALDKAKEADNKIIHDINGTKVSVSKNKDGSYTLEANGKKFKSDDPSFFRDTLKPNVKKALAKEVGIEVKTAQTTKVPSGKKISYEDDIVAVYDNKGKKVYEGILDYSPYQLDDSKWNATDKNYDLPKGYKMVGK